MITISLDEQGQFETYKGVKNEPTFLAGVLFDDNEMEGESDRERERIESFYRLIIWKAKQIAQCNEAQFAYPSALHVVYSSPAEEQLSVIGQVKTLVSQALPEFIQHGTYEGRQLKSNASKKILEPRKGIYQLYVCLKSPNGITNLTKETTNYLAKDDFASNLYFHMADLVIKRLIFENPYKSKSCPYLLELASRTTKNIKDMPLEEQAEFKKQNHKEHSTKNRKEPHYQIANNSMYRFILSDHLIESNKPGLKIENFEARSIYYQSKTSSMEFLYLADSLCSYLGYKTGNLPEEEWLSEIRKRIETINGNSPEDNYIFAYDDIDVLFDKALTAQREQRYFQFYEYAYEASQKTDRFAKLYQETWFQQLLDRTVKSKRTKPLFATIFELNQCLYAKKRNLKKELFIFEQLEKKADIIQDELTSDIEKSFMYQLYRIGTIVYAEAKNKSRALECYKKCKEFENNFDSLLQAQHIELESIKEKLL